MEILTNGEVVFCETKLIIGLLLVRFTETREDESLQQFCKWLTRLAAKNDFRPQTKTFVYDIFIPNWNLTSVRERLRREWKEKYEEAINFAVTFEEAIKVKRPLETYKQDRELE